MRKLKRSVARANMERAGFHHVNKRHGARGTSFFAANWRKFVH